MLFPASTWNNTEQIFITCRELYDVKKSLINSKIYRLLGIIDLKKINNWNEIIGQPLWINAMLEEQNEINNSRHLCFPFMTLTLNVNFKINLVLKWTEDINHWNLPIKLKKKKLLFY